MTTSLPSEDTLWTVKDLARLLKASPSWVYKNAERGTIPCVHIGALLRFDPAAIRAWLASKSAGNALTESANQSVEVVSAKQNPEKG
jgi:excisionase family DNA binding protein